MVLIIRSTHCTSACDCEHAHTVYSCSQTVLQTRQSCEECITYLRSSSSFTWRSLVAERRSSATRSDATALHRRTSCCSAPCCSAFTTVRPIVCSRRPRTLVSCRALPAAIGGAIDSAAGIDVWDWVA